MSQGKKVAPQKGPGVPHGVALELAEKLARYLAPVCQRVNVAGSLRRGKEEVGDIELVCIPNQSEDLFGNMVYQWNAIPERMARQKMIKGGNRYQQYEVEDCIVDIYVTTLEQWGVMFTLRTGSAEFSRKLVTSRTLGGYMPRGMRIEKGILYKGKYVIETFTELQLFQALGLTWLPPEEREVAS